MLRYLVFLLLILAGLAWAAESPLTAVVTFDKPVYFLGEPIMLRFGLLNSGKTPVEIETGGDYRGLRELRYTVSAVDARGEAVPDPYRNISCMGGAMGGETIAPGETRWHSLCLWRYLEFTQPGRYTVRVTHDLGWSGTGEYVHRFLPTGATPPVGEGTLTLQMPTPAQAKGVLDALKQLPSDPHRVSGGREAPFADHAALAVPVYIPLLLAEAQGGNGCAIDGLAAIGTPEATAALLALANHGDDTIADLAAQAVLERVPNAEWQLNTRRDFPQRTWRPDFTTATLNRGRVLLHRRSSEVVGARLLAAVGSQHEVPLLSAALDASLARGENDRNGSLAYAAYGMIRRGVLPPAQARTPAAELLLVMALGRHPQWRPTGWERVAQRVLARPGVFLRATAMRHLPTPLPESLRRPVRTLIGDKDARLQSAALELAARDTGPSFAAPAFALLTTSTDTMVIGAARAAAAACGIPADQWAAVCIDRMTEPTLGLPMLKALATLVIYEGGYSETAMDAATAARLQARWRRFLADHRATIHAGTRFPIGQPPLTADLFAPAYTFSRKTGGEWPPTPPVAPGVSLRNDADRAAVRMDGDHAVIEITSPTGIGNAGIYLGRPRPTALTIRLRLRGLEELSLEAGTLYLRAAVNSSDGTLHAAILDPPTHTETSLLATDPRWLPLRPSTPGPGFEFALPPAILNGGSELLTLRWIDFYR